MPAKVLTEKVLCKSETVLEVDVTALKVTRYTERHQGFPQGSELCLLLMAATPWSMLLCGVSTDNGLKNRKKKKFKQAASNSMYQLSMVCNTQRPPKADPYFDI